MIEESNKEDDKQNILEVLPTEILFEIISYLKLSYMKNLSLVSKSFLMLTQPFFLEKSFLHLKKHSNEKVKFMRKYSKIQISCFIRNDILQNLVDQNEETLEDISLERYRLQEEIFVVPSKCILRRFSVSQDLNYFEESDEIEIIEDLVRMLRSQKTINTFFVKGTCLSLMFFERINVCDEIHISTCSLKSIPSFQNASFKHLKKAVISNCSFETMDDIRSVLASFSNVYSLEMAMITCRNYNEGMVRVRMPNLKYWNISHCRGISWVEAPRLHRLSVNGVKIESGQNYGTVFRTSPDLKAFFCSDFLESDGRNQLVGMENIEFFEVLIDKFNVETLEYILKNFKFIRSGKLGFYEFDVAEEDIRRVRDVCLQTGYRYLESDFNEIVMSKENVLIIAQYWRNDIDDDDFY